MLYILKIVKAFMSYQICELCKVPVVVEKWNGFCEIRASKRHAMSCEILFSKRKNKGEFNLRGLVGRDAQTFENVILRKQFTHELTTSLIRSKRGRGAYTSAGRV